MASRTLFRRFVHASKKLQMRGVVQSARPLASIHHLQQRPGMPVPERYSQIRGLCSKAGEGMVINIQDENDFEERVINNPVPVVVDFHATWCGPCKMLGPRLESLVGARNGKVILAKVDVDDIAEVAMNYRISSVPTVIGVRNKEKVDQFVGLQDDDTIETFLDKLIG